MSQHQHKVTEQPVPATISPSKQPLALTKLRFQKYKAKCLCTNKPRIWFKRTNTRTFVKMEKSGQ